MSGDALIGDAGDSPGFLLWRVTQRWQRSIVAALRPLDLTHAQFVLLMSTAWLGAPGQGRGPGSIGAALRPLDLTHAQFVLLMSTAWLARHGEGAGPSQREVADHADAD